MGRRVLGYEEVLRRLKAGEGINWVGGISPSYYFDFKETIRYDTVLKLAQQGLLTSWGFPQLHGTIKYKAPIKEDKMGKPKCELIGTDGNVFALAGRVTKALKKAGLPEKAAEFSAKLTHCKSYDEALVLMQDYVEVS